MIRWITPPSRRGSPNGSFETIAPTENKPTVGTNEAAYTSNNPLVVRFDEEQIKSDRNQPETGGGMEGLIINQSPPTPIDDTPYIRFAIDQLTRSEDVRALQRPSTATSSDSYPVDRMIPDYGLGYMSEHRAELALTRKHRSTPVPSSVGNELFKFHATRPLSHHSVKSVIPPRRLLSAGPPNFVPIEPPTHSPRYPNLQFTPSILRPQSMITLSALCLLMIAALMFAAIYSTYNKGLSDFSGGNPNFVFGFLPQLVSGILFLYIQGVVCAMTRIMPFLLMATDSAEYRSRALFLGIYPRTMLFPNWEGPGSIKLSNTIFWLSVFTIPLQSCLFSVTQVQGVWRWTVAQAIAWTLVAIYTLVCGAIAMTLLFFRRRTTGLIWDPRSLADIISLLPRSNSLGDYVGSDIMRKHELRDTLALRSDRLGYWAQHRTQGLFYCIGEEGTATRRYTLESGILQEKKVLDQSSDVESNVRRHRESTRFAYISWYLQDTFVLFWAVASFVILLALFVVSFVPRTAISQGFSPLVSAVAHSGFSPANFLYSFVPSVLGMLLHIWFQSLDMGLRKLQPWAELSRSGGATADNSLLLDYTAEYPVKCSMKAFDGGHYRVAILSLLSLLFLLLPILAGGIFFPLTTPANEVRMIPNLPAFYICLTLLVLYLLGLLSLVPNRRLMHLPHDVDCLAEIISFVHGSRILDDAAFRAPRSKADLSTRLMAAHADGRDARYAFGSFVTNYGKECFGIEKIGRQGVYIHI